MKVKRQATAMEASSGTNSITGVVICGNIREAYCEDCTMEAVTAADRPSTRPMDRSVPARTIRPAQPSARMPLVEACLTMLSRLVTSRKVGRMMQTTTRIISRMMYSA